MGSGETASRSAFSRKPLPRAASRHIDRFSRALCKATYYRGSALNKLVVGKCRDHEQREVGSPSAVRREKRVADMLGPNRQPFAVAFVKIAAAHNGPLGSGGENSGARAYLVVKIGNPKSAGDRTKQGHERAKVPRVAIFAVKADVPVAGKHQPRRRVCEIEHGLGSIAGIACNAPGNQYAQNPVATLYGVGDDLAIIGAAGKQRDLVGHGCNLANAFGAVVAGFRPPRAEGHWQFEIRLRAQAARDQLCRRHWAGALIVSRPNMGPNILSYIEATLACLVAAGFTLTEADAIWNTLDAHLYGFTLQKLNFPFEPAEYAEAVARNLDRIPHSTLPQLHELAQLVATRHYDGLHSMEHGLDLLLAGLQARLSK